MKHIHKALCLLLLLVGAQHGAVVHELSHLAQLSGEVRAEADRSVNENCALCLAFAQVVNPAGHSLHVPLTLRPGSALSPERLFCIATADAPVPAAADRPPN